MSVNRKFLIITYIQNDIRTIGSNYVFASVRSKGIDVKMLYIKTDIELNQNALKKFLHENNFGVIGIRLYTMDFYYTVRLTKIIRQISPESFIFWGGVHPTCEPKECLEHVNCICMGEGEQCVADIVNNYEQPDTLKTLEGVGMRQDNGDIILNRAAYIDDIDSLPYPYYEFNQNQYILDDIGGGGGIRKLSESDYANYSRHGGDGYALITSRSCPNNCSYCINSFYNKLYSHKGKNRFFRRRSVKNTLEEIIHAMHTIPGIKFINFLDDHFLVGEDWINEFIVSYGQEIALPFMIRATPESVTEAKISRLKNVGLSVAQVGIQSGCAATHRNIFHRKFNRDKIIFTAEILHKLVITAMYDFIIGNEFETTEAKKDTIKLMMELPKPYIPNIFHIIPFPRTDIVEWYRKNHVTPKLNPYHEDYMDLGEDFFAMLATIVPITDNELIEDFLTHMDESECKAEVKRRYMAATRRDN